MRPLLAFLSTTISKSMPTPRLRAWYLRRMGAQIGTNSRIHAIDFVNAECGFEGLRIGSDCYIGPGVLIDLSGEVRIDDGAVISSRAILMSHDDPGSAHQSPLCAHFPPARRTTLVGRYCWLGVGSIVLAGSEIGDQSVLAAGSVARGKLEAHGLYAGHPAMLKRTLVDGAE